MNQAHSSSIAIHRSTAIQRLPRNTTEHVVGVPRPDPPPNEPRPGAKLKQAWSYSAYVTLNIFPVVVAFLSASQDITQHAKKLSVVVCGILVYITFLTKVILMLFTYFLWTLQHIGEHQYLAVKILIYVSNVLFMLASVGLLVLLDKSYAFLAVLLLPIIGIVGILFHKEIQTAQDQLSTGYEDYEMELKQFFDLSAPITFITFSGMMSTISFYFKKFDEEAGHLGITVSESLTFFTIVFGLLSMLLTTVPPSFNQLRTREHLISVIRALGYVQFGLQTLTGFEVAAGFVKGFVVLAFFPDFVGALLWFRMEFLHERRGDEEGGLNDEPEISAISAMILIFTILMYMYSKYRGEQDYGLHLRICMLVIFTAFKSTLGWMMLTFKAPKPKPKCLVMVTNIVTRSTLFLLAVAVLDASFIEIPAIYKSI